MGLVWLEADRPTGPAEGQVAGGVVEGDRGLRGVDGGNQFAIEADVGAVGTGLVDFYR